jgi:organic hydroperoxide reductase OsmC/OhrA
MNIQAAGSIEPYPHRYRVRADMTVSGPVQLDAPGLSPIESLPPPEFGGPPGHWSPETLLCAAVADCFVLSFRAVARASRLAWQSLEVDVEGMLERTEDGPRFTRFTVSPRLCLGEGASEVLARTVLEKAKRSCLVSNSLRAESVLAPTVVLDCAPEAAAASAA